MKIISNLLLIFTLIGFINCNNHKEKINTETEVFRQKETQKLNEVLKKYEVPSQKFKVLATKSIIIKGKDGTTIFINPDDLEMENKNPLGTNIEVELKELLNQEQLLKNNAQTVSEGKLLVSGGAYFINVTSDGQQLKLKEGKTLSVGFPKISDNEMSLFYGQRDSLGKIDWQKSEMKFVNNVEAAKAKFGNPAPNPTQPTMPVNSVQSILADSFAEEKEHLSSEEIKKIDEINDKNSIIALQVYETIKLKQLGWINCDRFLEITNKTNLQFEFNSKDSIVVANVYLIFKDINSVMESSYFSFKGKTFNSSFDGIPVDSKVKLIAFSEKNGKLFSHSSELTITQNQKFKFVLREIKEKEFDKIFE
jgi:hypothetical protein